VLLREVGEGKQVLAGVAHHLFNFGQLPAQHHGDGLELLGDVLGVGLGKHGADRRSDHFVVAAGDLREHVT
jgi:hypothetical protein